MSVLDTCGATRRQARFVVEGEVDRRATTGSQPEVRGDARMGFESPALRGKPRTERQVESAGPNTSMLRVGCEPVVGSRHPRFWLDPPSRRVLSFQRPFAGTRAVAATGVRAKPKRRASLADRLPTRGRVASPLRWVPTSVLLCSQQGGDDERSAGFGWDAKRRLRPDLGRQAQEMGRQRAAFCRLGDLSSQGLARRSRPDLRLAVERLVRPADPALERRRQDLGAGRQQVRL